MPEDTWRFLELDEDESEHLKKAHEQPNKQLGLANEAAKLALYGMSVATDETRINEPRTLTMLLLAKSAQEIRLASMALGTGYYSGAATVLRSAFEALAYAALFNQDPGSLRNWHTINLSVNTSSRPPRELDSLRNEQTKAAKKALFAQETDPQAIREALNQFCRDANARIHVSLEGLASEFGISIEQLFPDDFVSLLETGNDFEHALNLYTLLAQVRVPNKMSQKASANIPPGDEIPIYMTVHHDKETLDNLALIAFYIAHRALDLTKDVLTISDEDFIRSYKAWHKELDKS